jgi:hypothetical protein
MLDLRRFLRLTKRASPPMSWASRDKLLRIRVNDRALVGAQAWCAFARAAVAIARDPAGPSSKKPA